uniref:Transcription initiation factor TFIID subunit 8 n=1 Tax=Steinernema glaseri TaxID=37863 RepID=A0A1I8A0I0_9BILA
MSRSIYTDLYDMLACIAERFLEGTLNKWRHLTSSSKVDMNDLHRAIPLMTSFHYSMAFLSIDRESVRPGPQRLDASFSAMSTYGVIFYEPSHFPP